MGIAPNASIAQFTAAYAGALTSLGIGCAPQLLNPSGAIIYSGEATGPDEPLMKIDGSRSTAARDEYVMLSVPKEKIFAEPKDRDVSILDPTSPFLSEIDHLEEILDSRKTNITQNFAGRDHQGYMVRNLSLRDILKALHKGDPSTSDPSLKGIKDAAANIVKIVDEGEASPSDPRIEGLRSGAHEIATGSGYPSLSDSFIEGVKDAAYAFAVRANDKLIPGQRDELEAAGLFFAAAVLFAGLADEKSMERAVEMFAHSAKYFFKTHENPVAAAAVTEILAWLKKDDPKWRDPYLVQAADRWEEAARALHGRGDVFGATIAVYRGLRAAALSSHHEDMKVLFSISSRINGERKNAEGQMGDYLRGALMILKMHEDGRIPDEKLVWEEAYGGLNAASMLMKDQGMIDAIKPFLAVARERSGYDLRMEIRRAAQEAVADPKIVPPSESDDLYERFSEIVEEAIEHHRLITEAGHKITPEAAARAIVHKRRKSYIDLAYMRYCQAFKSGRIYGYPCKREQFASREKDVRQASIYGRFREIEALGIRPGMNVANGTIKRINWNGMIVCARSDGGTSVNSPNSIAFEILMYNPKR